MVKYDGIKAVILDLDGVVTHTAALHARAWKRAFDRYRELRRSRGGEDFEAFDEERDYRNLVDGKPRYDGVRSFLESRGISIPEGESGDGPGTESVYGLGNLKNEIYHELLRQQGADVFPDAVDLVRRCHELGMETAVVSSSRNCSAVLDSADLSDVFAVRVDGTDSERLHLKGKPEPDLFLEAARRLGVQPAQAAVIEDSAAGVEAANRGGFGLVIGVDRKGDGRSLIQRGAHLAVRTLDELQGPEGAVFREISEQAGLSHGTERRRLKPEILQALRRKRVAVFLDYDGTLTPIVKRPEDARLSESMRDAVQELAAECSVAVVSGRDRRDVRGLVGLEGLVYAGSHGFDIAGPDGLKMEHEDARARLGSLDGAEEQLRERLLGISGVWVERKRYAVAVHYRNAPEEEEERIQQVVEGVAERYGDLRQRGGKKIFELQPDLDWDKGKAVQWLLESLDLWRADVLPVYVGDDLTDEDAFRALSGRGLRFVVGPLEHETAADYYLQDVHEVERLLRALTKELGAKRDE